MPDSPDKRRWFQFGLRKMMVAVLLLGIGLGWLGIKCHNVRERRRTVRQIEEMGGFAAYHYEWGDGKAAEPPGPAWLRAIFGDDFFANVVAVELMSPQVNDDNLASLSRLRQLKVLWLDGSHITDDGLVHLQSLKHLEYLSLVETRVTDAGLRHLSGLKRLRTLYLVETQISDAGLVHLRGLTHLESLALGDTKITGDGLTNLKRLKNLRTVSLTRAQATTGGARELQRALPNMSIGRYGEDWGYSEGDPFSGSIGREQPTRFDGK